MKKKIELKMEEGVCEAWEVTPFKDGHYPAVLMYMDAIGVRESLLDLAQRIADKGLRVLVPNLFYRSHSLPLYDYPETFDKQKLGEFFPTVKPFMEALTPEKLIKDAGVYLSYLGNKEISIVGYCFGGGHAVRTAATYPERVKAVVSLHGGKLATDDQTSPHHYLKDVKATLYFGHADHDSSMPLPMIRKLEEELKKNHISFSSEIYPGAHHGFTQKDLPAYNEEASEKSFMKTIDTLLAGKSS